MDSAEIASMCRADAVIKKYSTGVHPIDRLPCNVAYPCCFVANTKPSGHEGEHWVAIYVDEQRRGTYFCSYGREPKPILEQWLNRNTDEWTRVQKRVQGVLSTTCGQYCVCFLHFKCRDVSNAKILSLFSNNWRENDDIVTAFINGFYDTSTVVNKTFH